MKETKAMTWYRLVGDAAQYERAKEKQKRRRKMTKYKCKRCGNVITIKVPNCPKCSSSDGYKLITIIQPGVYKTIDGKFCYLPFAVKAS